MLLLVAALSEEASGLLRTGRFQQIETPDDFVAYVPDTGRSDQDHALGTGIAIVLTGTGRERATAAMSWALEQFQPEAVISFGFGGGTMDTLQPGDLVLGTRLFRLDGSPFYWDEEQLGDPLIPDRDLLRAARNAVEIAGIDFELGPIVNLPSVAKTAGMKRWIGQELDGAAVEMESFVVCELAADAGIPFAAVRAVVDTVEMDLPALVGQVDQAPSGGRIIPAIKHLARNPFALRSLTRLGRAAGKARRSLTDFFLELSAELDAGPEARWRSSDTQEAVT